MNAPTAQQQQAIQARGNVLVAAGAGTGKTRTLVQRCLRLLRDGGSLENILMVTFTDAAAVEMRGRLRDALMAEAGGLAAAAPQEPGRREHFEKQLALLDTALISTLHSLCLQLVREHFYELGIDPDFSVLDEQQIRPLIRQSLDAILERHYAGEGATDRALQQLVRGPGRGSDERLRALVVRLHRYSQSRARPEEWLAGQQACFEQAAPGRWREWLEEEFPAWRSLWSDRLKDFSGHEAVDLALQALGRLPPQPVAGQITQAAAAIRSANLDPANWPRGSVKTVRSPLKRFFEEADFLASLAASGQADPLAEDWEFVRHDLLALLALTREFTTEFARAKRESGGVDFADLEQFALRVLWQPGAGAVTPAALEWRERLHHIFVDEYQDINEAQDRIIEALSRDGPGIPPPDGATAAVSRSVEPRRERRRSKFADSPAQLEFASELLATERSSLAPEGTSDKARIEQEAPSDQPGNRFLVGDVKQSIYRFRLADPTIFRRYEKRWQVGAPGGRRLPLTENFRSHPGLLDFVNALFAPLMRERIGGVDYEGLVFGNAAERAALATHRAGEPRVELHVITRYSLNQGADEANGGEAREASEVADLLTTEREARLVALRLQTLKEQEHAVWDPERKRFRPVEWGDMAVLLRSPRGRVEAFAKEFEALQVPLEAARGGFFESLEISDLISLLRLLDNPMQDIPLLAVLRSPLVGLSAAELAEVRAEEAGQRAPGFWLAARRFLAQGRESSAAWRKLRLFYGQLERWRQLIRQTSLSYCLEIALGETHYEMLLRAGPRGEQQAANVRRLLTLAREYDPYQRQGLFRFLRFVQAQEEEDLELETAPVGRDAVRLLSIHKSKGLEFPVVVVAGMGGLINLRDLHETILLDEKYGLCPKISPPEGARNYPSLPYWLARRRQHRELLGEEMRLLYVAMTRARDTLLLTGTAPGKADPRWASTPERLLTDRELLSARSYLDWIRLWLPLATRDEEWTGECEGRSKLLRWTIYSENDTRLLTPAATRALPVSQPAGSQTAPRGDAGLLELGARLNWNYPYPAATQQRAKMSVTELRQWRTEEEASPARFLQRSQFVPPLRRPEGLSAAEIGVAHHRFLQRVSLSRTGSIVELREEAARLGRGRWLADAELAALDFEALAQFWCSDFGRSIASQAEGVRRELQFTARFTAADLNELKLDPPAGLPADEFVVVQGMVDLAVMLPREIWIVDFKTDAVAASELSGKIRLYEPQLQLYARALSRIHRRTVTECRLHFLACRTTVPVPVVT